MRYFLRFFIFLMFISVNTACFAELVPINPPTGRLGASKEPIMTMYWPGQKSKSLIIFFPGGDGRIGLKTSTKDLNGSFYQLLKGLSDPSIGSGRTDVVIFDTPYELSWPAQRADENHLMRIENTVEFYRKKTGLPIWIMGHSNGAVSVTEFIKYLQKNNRPELIDGAIISGGQNNTEFISPLSIPILFLHHEEDGCINTQPKFTYAAYQKVKQFDKANIQYILIKGGEYSMNDPCTSGYHMYLDAEEEVKQAIERYLAQQYK